MWKLKETAERRELDEILAKIVEEAGTQNLGWAISELKKLRKKSFGVLFDSQLETLKKRGVSDQVIETLSARKETVLRKAGEIDIGGKNIPFLPIISALFTDLSDLIKMVRFNDKIGESRIDLRRISDNVYAPSELYYIFNVEIGEQTAHDRSIKLATYENAIFEMNRSPLRTDEAISLAIHTDVLEQCIVFAAGSRLYDFGDKIVPYVGTIAGDPILSGTSVHENLFNLGVASCGFRDECL